MPVFSRQSAFFRLFPYFKWLVYFLLAVNVVLFFTQATWIEGVDSISWVALLLLFEWETTHLNNKKSVLKLEKLGLHGFRLLAYTVVLYSAYQYMQPSYIATKGVIDAFNAVTWIMVVIVLEYDVYAPARLLRQRWPVRSMIKLLLYIALISYALIWGINGELLNFYDAFLWILCFFVIELNIFKFEQSSNHEPVRNEQQRNSRDI